MASLCVMCGFQSVPKQRRLLHSTSTVYVLLLPRRLTHDRMDVNIDVPSSVLCIRCFRLLDKCVKLKRELDLAEQEAAACVKVMSDTYTAPSVSSEVHTPVQRKRSSDNRGDLVGNQLSPAVSVR